MNMVILQISLQQPAGYNFTPFYVAVGLALVWAGYEWYKRRHPEGVTLDKKDSILDKERITPIETGARIFLRKTSTGQAWELDPVHGYLPGPEDEYGNFSGEFYPTRGKPIPVSKSQLTVEITPAIFHGEVVELLYDENGVEGINAKQMQKMQKEISRLKMQVKARDAELEDSAVAVEEQNVREVEKKGRMQSAQHPNKKSVIWKNKDKDGTGDDGGDGWGDD